MEGMMPSSDRELLAALTVLALPIVISLILQPTWSSRRRVAVAFAVTFLWTIGGAFFVNDATVPTAWDWRSVVRLLGLNVIGASVIFRQLQSAGIIQRIEAATSPPSRANERLIDEAERKERPPMDPEATP